MLKGFKNFVMRGNVIELAVGVAIAAAFTAVIDEFTRTIINPLLAAVGGADTAGWGFFINQSNEATFVDVGALVGAVIQFLITAAVIYFALVVPMNRVSQARGPEPETPAEDELAVLSDIRDLLKTRS